MLWVQTVTHRPLQPQTHGAVPHLGPFRNHCVCPIRSVCAGFGKGNDGLHPLTFSASTHTEPCAFPKIAIRAHRGENTQHPANPPCAPACSGTIPRPRPSEMRQHTVSLPRPSPCRPEMGKEAALRWGRARARRASKLGCRSGELAPGTRGSGARGAWQCRCEPGAAEEAVGAVLPSDARLPSVSGRISAAAAALAGRE